MKDAVIFTNFQNQTEAAEAEAWGGADWTAAPGSDDGSPQTTMKNPNGPSIEEIDDMHDQQRDEREAEDKHLLDKVMTTLRHLHAEAESDATNDQVSDAARALSMEEFNVAAWNHLPWILDKLNQFRNQAKLGWARAAEKDRAYEATLADHRALDWMEEQFAGTFRNSVFLGHDIDGSGMINMDLRSQPSVVHRAKTVRGCIRLAMDHQNI